MYTHSIGLNEKSPVLQNAVIAYFMANDIPVYEKTTKFDNEYPYLYWDGNDGKLSQRRNVHDCAVVVKSVEEFLKMFDDIEEVRLSDNYVARIEHTTRVVTVGCQDFEFDKVLELADAIRKRSNK
jgi:hypothetical protein